MDFIKILQRKVFCLDSNTAFLGGVSIRFLIGTPAPKDGV